MRTLLKWSTVPLLVGLALVATRSARTGAASLQVATLGRAPTMSYAPHKHFVITLDLGSTPVSTVNTDYVCNLTYLGDDGSAMGTQTTDTWKCIGKPRPHPKLTGNIVTLKFRAERSLPIKNQDRKFDSGTGTGTVVISMPNAPTTPTTPMIPVDDVGLDPCDNM